MNAAFVESAIRLPVSERFQLLDSIWTSITKDLERERVPAALLEELERRDAAYERNPAAGMTLEQVEEQLFPQA
jgi:putative addiction module component (TIGR02574 family)